MSRSEAKFFIVEFACAAAAVAGVVIMFLDSFERGPSALGLLLAGLGVAAFSVTHWLRRQCNIRFRR